MKRIGILWLLLIMILLSACSGTTDAQKGKPSYEELESQLQEVTKNRDDLQSELDALKAEGEAEKAATTVQEGDITVLVTDKTVTPKDPDNWIFSNYVNFIFLITNNTEKDIQGIQGEIIVDDLFGEEILTMGCDFTGEIIPAGTTVENDDLFFECNEFVSEDMKLFNENYKDLQFIYVTKQIVFTDGTVKES